MATFNLSMTKSGYVKQESASTVFPTNTNTWYDLLGSSQNNTQKYLYMMFGAYPSNIRHKALRNVSLTLYTRAKAGRYSSFSALVCEQFNPGTLTYLNQPELVDTNPSGSTRRYLSYSFGSGSTDFTGNLQLSAIEGGSISEAGKSGLAYYVLKHRAFRISGYDGYLKDSGDIGQVKTVLQNGSTAPYLTIEYDNSTNILSSVGFTSKPTGTISSNEAQTVAWDYTKASGQDYYCVDDTWAQRSAIFYWKAQSASTWNQIPISGNVKSLTIPAGTFPAASTVQFYLSGTDEEGTTSQTEVFSVTTDHSVVTPALYPNGTTVNASTAQNFTWTLPGSARPATSYEQASATLFWKSSTESDYHQIAISGATKAVTVPANTFPTAATIQWYLQVTDTFGYTSTSSVRSFGTLDFSLNVVTKPSGSNIGTQSEIAFQWTLKNAQQTDVPQQSAVLYWRVQGGSQYTEITSTSAKEIFIPANTFPTGKTIQWYLSVTAYDNRSKSTEVATFSTVTTKITPTQYPTGNSVYSGTDITFKWKFASNDGDYAQTSATFYWRSTTAEDYRSISISGNTQQVTIPANTFPTNATINWYVSGVDIGGYSSTASVQSFGTSTTQITPQNSPTSGYTNPRNAITFSWYFAASGGSIPQGSASLFWRINGESEYNEVAASGSISSVTIPADTFPVASVIEWYLSGSDISGTSSQTDVYSFSTTAATIYAVVKSPVNSGVDGSSPITFQWTLTTADGYPASRVILQWKLPTEDDQHWHTIVDIDSEIAQYTVDGNTFQPGEINWRVRAYNVDGVEGLGTSASFVCIIAPSITSLTASNVPFSVVSWQAVDQQGYQLEIDGVKYGPYPGTEKQFEIPDYFRDGVHVIRLRILGTVDLWSNWAETTVSIENEPGNPVIVQAESGINVLLEWQNADTETDYYIYRDGKLIGRTENTRFVDRFSLGTHEYVVINRLTSGNYSVSEVLSETTEVKYIYLSTIDGLTDVEVIYSLKNKSDPVHKTSRESHLNTLSGQSYPALTKSRFMDHVIDCSAVFLYTESEKIEAFQNLLGEGIIAKLCDGTCCAAVIESYTITPKKTYYTAYDFTLHQIEWEDFDDTQ